MSKLYVGNLSYSVTTDLLKDHFSQIGNVVDCVVIVDKMSGRSKGFGFVEFSSEEEAKKAIETLDGQEFEGRQLHVNPARPPKQRSSY